ncbi:DUF4886 domain-containing protein [Brumimicrobium aurantiacum]|uniref:DUF4886 domain-containing protein n=1 Tax=Brumimicrobium aurantiacum TaxID=1737063 RepID=A0A3E1F158_9FLAO|nr:DUF4886 domain-containing protein [Brumimicrobium aurantiacum]RFC55479.1 DUF4886 domain-containing protein [Brumimicrobium aurantiacum]
MSLISFIQQSVLMFSLLVLLCCTSAFVFGQTKNVLFIGNSFTMNNQMPKKLEQMASREGESLYTEQVTVGGKGWDFHARNSQTYTTIKNEPWDYVVLQAMSFEPLYPEHVLQQNTIKNGQIIIDSIRHYHPDVKIMLFMTWGYKEGIYIDYEYQTIDYAEMQSRLQRQYMRFGELYCSAIAPIGKVWEKTRSLYPDYNLYSDDNYHQSELGSYLIASTFYSMIYDKSLQDFTQIPFRNVAESQARNINSIVREVLLYPGQDWGRNFWLDESEVKLHTSQRLSRHFFRL